MKFVFFGYDFMFSTVQRLLDDGHELKAVFTFSCDNIFNFNRDITQLAELHKAQVFTERPVRADIDGLIACGVTCFLAGGYIYKIPQIDDSAAYGVNIHPSLLPQGRGLMPTPSIILQYPEASGFTIHKLTQEFDGGDILYQEALPLHTRESVETLSCRIAMRAPNAVSEVLKNLPAMWKAAKPQDQAKASVFKAPDEIMRSLDWTKNVADIDRIARAFGRYGSIGRFDDALWIVYNLDVWQEIHDFTPGTLVCILSREIVIAARDGFVCLKEFQKVEI